MQLPGPHGRMLLGKSTHEQMGQVHLWVGAGGGRAPERAQERASAS